MSARSGGLLDPVTWRLHAPLRAPLRRGALASAPVGVASLLELATDEPVWGGIATASLLSGFIAFEAPARVRAIWQLAFAPIVGAAAALGVLSTNPAGLAVAGMTLCGIAGGYCVAVSPRLAVAGMMAVLAFLLSQGFLLDSDEAPRALAAGIAGGLLQALLSASVWWLSDRSSETPGLAVRARAARRVLRENLSLRHPSLRHALRWGGALGAAVAIYRLVDLQGHGYWIPLTVLFVLKPSTDDTWERVAMRTAGTIAGLLLATALAESLGATAVPVAIVLTIAAALSYALLTLEYALFTAAITIFVVLLTDALGEGAFEAADQRAVATALGLLLAAIAIAVPLGREAQAG
ncbi:MAG: FUSC family protein [Solirubrobacterales bacterium]